MNISIRLHTGTTVVLTNVEAQATLTDLKHLLAEQLAEHHDGSSEIVEQSSWRLRGNRVDDEVGPIWDKPFYLEKRNATTTNPFDVRPVGESDEEYAAMINKHIRKTTASQPARYQPPPLSPPSRPQ